jgi:cytochrome c peroxidase
MPNLPLRPSIKRAAFALAVSLFFAGSSLLHAEDGVIDLAVLPNYAKQPRPANLVLDNTPASILPGALPINPITNTGATLGRLLFYDKRMSRNDTVSCSSCHQQGHAFSIPDIAGQGVGGMTNRHPMRLINPRFSESYFFWDNRAPTLENQTTQPIRNPIELGFSGTNGDPDFAAFLAKLSALPEYQLLFSAAFGSPGIDESRIQKALSQFIRSIQSFDSKYDAGSALPQPFSNFTDSETRGKQIFSTPDWMGGANCFLCHKEPTFSNTSTFGNNGVIAAIGGGTDLTVMSSPTLRDLVNPSGQLNGPLMHNGSFTSIQQVIEHYNAVPDNPMLSGFLKSNGAPQNLNLPQQKKLDLEAFLRTLSGTAVYTDPKYSNPFRPDGTISVIDAPPASQTVNLSSRMRVLTSDKVAIAGFIVTGSVPKRVLIRALGPSLAQFGLSNLLADPIISLIGPAGFAEIDNDNWQSSQQAEIQASGLAPGNGLESAIIATLAPGTYTAVLEGTNGGTGISILELYDLDFAAASKLANISTRAFVGTGDDILIAGFTVGKACNGETIVVRGLGQSLQATASVTQILVDPALEVRNANGATLAANDNWPSPDNDSTDIINTGLAPNFYNESAVILTLGPGAYTALLSAAPTPFPPGVGLVEIYSLGRLP